MASSLLAVVAVGSGFAVSCSASKIPALTTSVSYDVAGTKFKRESNGTLKSDTKIDFGGVEYDTKPPFKTEKDSDYIESIKANNYFETINLFTAWIQGFSFKLSKFIGTIGSGLTDSKQSNYIADAIKGDPNLTKTALALSSYLGSGADVLRYGVKNITFGNVSADLKNLDKVPTSSGEGESKVINRTPYPDKYVTKDENGKWKVDYTTEDDVTVTVSNVTIDFGWWKTTDGSNVIWMDNASFKPTDYNYDGFKEAINKGLISAPQDIPTTTSIKLQDFQFRLSPNIQPKKVETPPDTKPEDVKPEPDTKPEMPEYEYTGTYTLLDVSTPNKTPIAFTNLEPTKPDGASEETQLDKYTTTWKCNEWLLSFEKYAQGDVLNQTYIDFINKKDEKTTAKWVCSIFNLSITA